MSLEEYTDDDVLDLFDLPDEYIESVVTIEDGLNVIKALLDEDAGKEKDD